MNQDKSKLINLFRHCLDILRDSEHLTGIKALRSLGYLLILKLIESKLDTSIDISNLNYYKEPIDTTLFKYVHFSNLAKEKNPKQFLNEIWIKILSEHPKTRNIFVPNNQAFFGIKSSAAISKLFRKIDQFDFSKYQHDIQGEAYEEIIKDVLKGRILGQYFTPPEIKKFMVELIDPQLSPCGKTETIFDPCLGTGGFLITSLRYLKTKAIEQNIELNMAYMSTHGLGGREIELDTYQLAKANMLIATGEIFNTITYSDSIRNPILDKKYDIILTNPPFGIKGFNYKEMISNTNNANNANNIEKYLPIRTNEAISLFLQAIIYMLKIGGRCGIIIPNGKELNSSSKKAITIREYLFKTCDVQKIIFIPTNIFTHTAIRTCIVYFIKKQTNAETYQTKNINFYNYVNGESKYLASVNINQLKKNKLLLSYLDYREQIYNNLLPNETVKFKRLGEICTFKIGKTITKSLLQDGPYAVVSAGKFPMGFHHKWNRPENTICCSKDGSYAGFISKRNSRVFLTSHAFSIHIISDKLYINKEYLFYYLKHQQELIHAFKKGAAIPHVYITDLGKLIIPVPTIDTQNQIIKDIESIKETKIKKCLDEIDNLKKQINLYKIDIKNVFDNKFNVEYT